ncbi:MAG: HAMP domain-containing histidine kinase, partial [Planctomycetes bacterium]|nr:HAMP domain-containing histidine kinase [Planctomycetota bacterium]
LCLVVTAGLSALLVDARTVHRDLQRMFEELREVALTRSLLDELRGFQHWLDAVPAERPSADPLVATDLRHHRDAAAATFARFQLADDPSQPRHRADEAGILQRVTRSLDELAVRLAADRPIGDLREPLDVALHGAAVLASAVDHETREIGDDLDHRSARLAQFLLALGVAGLATVAWLGILLLRRVLLPVRELRDAAVAFGQGRRADELGDLATAFAAMALQLRQGREELEQRVEQRSREVLRTARLADLGSLAAGIAHEVNNPLASIAACAEGLLRDTETGAPPDQAHLREYLQIVRKEAMRTRDLTARLLRFARQDPNRRDEVHLAEELREVAPMFAHQFATAGVELAVDAPTPGPALLGDAAEWRQVVFNLVRNALDASPRGGKVHLRCCAEGGQAVLEVADAGDGIRAEDQDRLFEPFFTTKAPGKGTGLGLAIVHRIVTGHGGHIVAENGPRGGAVFRVTVPLAAAGPAR